MISRVISIVSPHQDDAALSLGLTIRFLARERVSVRIVNCFTISNYAPFSESRDVQEVSALRRHEDARFAKKMGENVEICDLDRFDFPLRRGGGRIEDAFSGSPFSESDLDEMECLSESLVPLLGDGLVLTPLALRDHIDHRISREASINAVRDGRLAFFEDLPYAAELTRSEVHEHVREIENVPTMKLQQFDVVDTADGTDKAHLLRAYGSQLGEHDYKRIASETRSVERIWGSPYWLGLFRELVGGVAN